jgi:hypothetical protein
VWAAFRHTVDVRWHERYHALLRLLDGRSCPEVVQWLYRDEATIRACVHALNYTRFGMGYCRELVRQLRHEQGFRLCRLRHRPLPELNPQERIRKWRRRVVTHNRWFVTLGDQIDASRNF